MMKIETIQEWWEKDSYIDPDNLHDESLKIPQLHSKYHTTYNTITLLRERAVIAQNKIRLQRYKFYTGKATQEEYNEEDFHYRIREKDALKQYMEADENLIEINLKIKYYDAMLKFLEDILKTLSNRTYQIKNAIDWHNFQTGFK